MVGNYAIMVYPDVELNFIPTTLPFFDPFTLDSSAMPFDSGRTAAKIMEMNRLIFTKPHFYFRLKLAAELELYLNPQPNPPNTFAYEYRGTTLNELYGKTLVVSDWNKDFMGR